MKDKTIKVVCRGAGLAALEELHPLQGNLKSLSAENYQKLKKAILKHGFSFPFFVWKNTGKLFTLDGHQRDRVLRGMKDEGFKVPRLPVDYIEAKNEKEAKEKILLLSSQYGEMTTESLEDFVRAGSLDVDRLVSIVELPTINIEALLAEIKEFGSPPASVKQNISRLEQIAARKKENAALAVERDTEKFIILVFESREQKAKLLNSFGLPPDERYIRADSLIISRRKPGSLIRSKSGRDIKAPPIRKAGATG